LTLIVPAKKSLIPSRVRNGLSTVGFRIPNHPLTKEVIKQVGPVVAPSANLSGKPSTTLRKHIEKDFGENFPVLDGGESVKGVESTIIGYYDERWYFLRKGSLPLYKIEEILGYELESKKSPSSSLDHYRIEAKVLLGKELYKTPKEAILGFKERSYKKLANSSEKSCNLPRRRKRAFV
jgi:L-threonylcarbamoyladenylate synthase